MGGRFLSLCEAMSRASRRGCPPLSWRRDCIASSPNTPLRVPTVGRILAEAVVLSILDRVPNPQSLDHLGVMIHHINHDIGRHGRQLAPARPSAGHGPSTANQGTPLDVDAALPLSTKSHIGIVDDEGERVVATGTVHLRLGVSGLIRLHADDYTLLGQAGRIFVHFNLERTTNRVGGRYAMVPIWRAGFRDGNGGEVLPIVDVRRFRTGTCTEVLQHVSLASVTTEQLALSLPGIRSTEQLRAALLQRYGAMFPGLDERQVVARGCAITRLILDG